MQFVKPQIIPIESGKNGNPIDLIKVVEMGYRICYKSEKYMKEGSESLIYSLLHEGEKSRMIHSSPLEHRRIRLNCAEWVANAIDAWQYKRGTVFISVIPKANQNTDGTHDHTIYGNFRAFFDFIKDISNDDEVICDWERRDEARIVINNELSKFFPQIFPYIKPWDETDNAIDWEGCTYLGEDTDYMTFKIITSRDMLQEFARHRTMSPNAESTRYCNYNKRGMSICCPLPYEWAGDLVEEHCHGFDQFGPNAKTFAFDTPKDIAGLYRLAACLSEMFYNKAIEYGALPQEARGLLLGCLKTEILLTGTYSEWAHFIRLRNDPTADPQMQYIAKQIEEWFVNNGVGGIRKYDCY